MRRVKNLKLKQLIIAFVLIQLHHQAQNKILLVGTNIATVNDRPNGTYLMEIAIPFNYLTFQGYEVELISPKGGKIAIYHKGDTVPVLKKIALDPVFLKATSASKSAAKVSAGEYCAIIFPGGYGHFWDVYSDPVIADLTAKIYEAGGVVASLGHGTADLLNVRLSNGEYLVKGKTLTCFPSWIEKEEMKEANYGALLPVDMQNELSVRGAILKVCTKENIRTCNDTQVVDTQNRLVTASFAQSGEFIAKEVIKLLDAQSKKSTIKK